MLQLEMRNATSPLRPTSLPRTRKAAALHGLEVGGRDRVPRLRLHCLPGHKCHNGSSFLREKSPGEASAGLRSTSLPPVPRWRLASTNRQAAEHRGLDRQSTISLHLANSPARRVSRQVCRCLPIGTAQREAEPPGCISMRVVPRGIVWIANWLAIHSCGFSLSCRSYRAGEEKDPPNAQHSSRASTQDAGQPGKKRPSMARIAPCATSSPNTAYSRQRATTHRCCTTQTGNIML
jgi:hypothetical protein